MSDIPTMVPCPLCAIRPVLAVEGARIWLVHEGDCEFARKEEYLSEPDAAAGWRSSVKYHLERYAGRADPFNKLLFSNRIPKDQE